MGLDEMSKPPLDPREALAARYRDRLHLGPDASNVGKLAGEWGAVVKGYARCDRCSARDEVEWPVRPTMAVGDFAVIMPKIDPEQYAARSMAPNGKGPRLLELMMERAKVDVSRVAWGAVAGCRKDAIGPEMIAGCRENVRGWLRGFETVLLVGTAKELWRPDVTVQSLALSEELTVGLWTDERHGNPQTWVVGVVSSPWTVFGHPEPHVAIGGMVRRLVAWQEVVGEVARGEMGKVLARMGRECASCGSRKVAYIDPDGLGWCNGHTETTWRGYGKKRKPDKLGGLDRWETVRVTAREDEDAVEARRSVVSLPFG